MRKSTTHRKKAHRKRELLTAQCEGRSSGSWLSTDRNLFEKIFEQMRTVVREKKDKMAFLDFAPHFS